jgi:hypothetical protein
MCPHQEAKSPSVYFCHRVYPPQGGYTRAPSFVQLFHFFDVLCPAAPKLHSVPSLIITLSGSFGHWNIASMTGLPLSDTGTTDTSLALHAPASSGIPAEIAFATTASLTCAKAHNRSTFGAISKVKSEAPRSAIGSPSPLLSDSTICPLMQDWCDFVLVIMTCLSLRALLIARVPLSKHGVLQFSRLHGPFGILLLCRCLCRS